MDDDGDSLVIIAIDGPAGSGKSTVAREVAKRLQMRYLDTGAMYRAITLLALEAGLVPDNIPQAEALAATAVLRLEERPNDLSRVFIGAREVTDEIRGRVVSQNVSAVSADPGVRKVLTKMQQAEAARGNVVLEGRDMGTVVSPNAHLKVYLTASIEERARRRQLQLLSQGATHPIDQLIADIAFRDAFDSGRQVAPLRKAGDAIEIDTTGLSIDQVVERICAEATTRRGPDMSAAGQQALSQATPNAAADPQVPPSPKKWPLSRMNRNPLDTWLYRLAYSFVPPIWKFIFRMEITGADNIPRSGPVVLASNHRSNLDPFFLGVSCPRQIHFMAKAELWKVGLLGRVIDAMGAFPITRGEADRQAVRKALEVLGEGALLGMFPEGHRQRHGGFGEINPGVTLFSLRDGVVTIPVVLDGTERVVMGRFLRLPKVRVTFGPPLEIPGADIPRSQRAVVAGQRLTAAFERLATLSERRS